MHEYIQTVIKQTSEFVLSSTTKLFCTHANRNNFVVTYLDVSLHTLNIPRRICGSPRILPSSASKKLVHSNSVN